MNTHPEQDPTPENTLQVTFTPDPTDGGYFTSVKFNNTDTDLDVIDYLTAAVEATAKAHADTTELPLHTIVEIILHDLWHTLAGNYDPQVSDTERLQADPDLTPGDTP